MTYLLPATRVPAPSDAYTVTAIKVIDGRDGYAYTGKLRAGKRHLGTVHNSGSGGATFVDLLDREKDGTDWYAWAAQWPSANGPRDDEWAAAYLAEEAILLKDITRAARKNIPVLIDTELKEPITAYYKATGLSANEPRHLEVIRLDPQVTAYWDGSSWQSTS